MTAANQPRRENPLVKTTEPNKPELYTEKSDEQIRQEMKDLVKRHSELLKELAKL